MQADLELMESPMYHGEDPGQHHFGQAKTKSTWWQVQKGLRNLKNDFEVVGPVDYIYSKPYPHWNILDESCSLEFFLEFKDQIFEYDSRF
jgi:hypothetical protein